MKVYKTKKENGFILSKKIRGIKQNRLRGSKHKSFIQTLGRIQTIYLQIFVHLFSRQEEKNYRKSREKLI